MKRGDALKEKDIIMKRPGSGLNGQKISTVIGKKLRKNLEKIGIFFKSNSDTEVLLKLYQTKKEKMLDEIEGMFSQLSPDLSFHNY